MTVKSVFFIRHGETDWNAERRWQGQSDVPLNEAGVAQAREAAAALSGWGLELLVASDLMRARETAQVIAETVGCPVITAPELREIHLGEAEGLLAEDVLRRIGEEAVQTWGSILPEALAFGFPSGETKREALDRARTFIETFLRRDHRDPIGFVSHGALMRTLLHSWFPGLSSPIRIPNAQCFALGFDTTSGEWTPRDELGQLVASLRGAPVAEASWW